MHPRAVAAAARHGLKLGLVEPVEAGSVIQDGDLVIAVCDNAHEALGEAARLHWSVPDPARDDTDAAFDEAFDDLAGRIDRLLPLLDRNAPGSA